MGCAKNTNKNPVAEKAVQELSDELLRFDPIGGAVSPMSLDVAIATLNSRIRSRGLSAREMWTQRDQFSGAQVPMCDASLAEDQHRQRLANHPLSEASKAPRGQRRPDPELCIGDIVYIYSDRNKSRARERYLVVSVDPPFCNVRKFAGTQLRSASYRVHMADCFKVPAEVSELPRAEEVTVSEPEDCDDQHPGKSDFIPVTPYLPPARGGSSTPSRPPVSVPSVGPPTPPAIPETISALPGSDNNIDSEMQGQGKLSSPDAPGDAPRRSGRRREPPAYLKDYVTDT